MKSIFILGVFPSRECSCIQTRLLALISPEAERGCGLSSSVQHHPLSSASELLLGPQVFGSGMALSFSREKSVEGGGCILVDAMRVLSRDFTIGHPEPGSHSGVSPWVCELSHNN